MDQLEELAEELGIDYSAGDIPDTSPVQEVSVDVDKKRVIKFVPVQPRSPEIGDHETKRIVNGQQLVLVEKKRPQCPTCGNILSSENDPLHLPGQCYVCDDLVCPECGVNCDSCIRWMCRNHASGHGVEEKAFCEEHRQDVEEKLGFEREKELEKMRHEHRMTEKELELKEKKQLEEQKRQLLKLEAEIKEKAEKLNIQQEKLKLMVWRHLVNKENGGNSTGSSRGRDLGNAVTQSNQAGRMRKNQQEVVKEITNNLE